MSESPVLNRDELKAVIGTSRVKAQIAWLNDQRIMWLPGIDGKPRVLRAHLYSVMGAGSAQKMPAPSAPNVLALRKKIAHGTKKAG